MGIISRLKKMTYDSTDSFNDSLDDNLDDDLDDTSDDSDDIISSTDSRQKNKNSAQVRLRIDELLERKRLKELLDDTDDW